MAKSEQYPGCPVMPVLNKARTYRVISLSKPGEYHIVDLARDRCSCYQCQYRPNSEKLCRPKTWCVAWEQEQREIQSLMPLITERLRKEAA